MNPPHQPRSVELYIKKTINVFFCQARVSAGYLSLNSRPFLRPAQIEKKLFTFYNTLSSCQSTNSHLQLCVCAA